MKITHLLFLFSILFFTSCGDDDAGVDTNLLAYDNRQNDNAPPLDAGQHELAVYFPASTMSQHVGKKLVEVEFYAGQAPDACRIKFYGTGTSTSPGSLLAGQDFDVTSLTTGDPDWHTYVLNTPLEITGEDLWISVFVNHLETKQTVGCDAGPRKEGGDWIWSSDTQTWEKFVDKVGDSVNWNIRGILEE